MSLEEALNLNTAAVQALTAAFQHAQSTPAEVPAASKSQLKRIAVQSAPEPAIAEPLTSDQVHEQFQKRLAEPFLKLVRATKPAVGFEIFQQLDVPRLSAIQNAPERFDEAAQLIAAAAKQHGVELV